MIQTKIEPANNWGSNIWELKKLQQKVGWQSHDSKTSKLKAESGTSFIVIKEYQEILIVIINIEMVNSIKVKDIVMSKKKGYLEKEILKMRLHT